ncbi:hypothetical protein, partial [Enterococcus faecalis]|uniref:hypothetical protein n=1 Tax=Enterococcus faecalis TaxID=1351 RepID=UPI0028C4FB96
EWVKLNLKSKRKNADLKKKLSQTAHTINEVKTMTCIKCKGQMIVWEKDRFGHAKAMPCPLCNKSGQGVAKKLAEIKKK